MQPVFFPSHLLSRQRLQFLGICTLIGFLLATLAIFAQPLRYGATSRVLIIQRSTGDLDPYTAAKAAERIADNIAQVMYTEDFESKVLTQDTSIDQKRFPTDARKRRTFWEKSIRTSLVPGTGLLAVTALSTEKTESQKIAQAVSEVVLLHGKEYIGGDMDVKIVDSPLISRFPVSPNIPLTLLVGILLGFAAGMGTIIYRGK